MKVRKSFVFSNFMLALFSCIKGHWDIVQSCSLSHVLEHMVRDGLSSGNITFGFDKSASWIVCSRQDT